jgi:hypothetical protein
LWPLSVFLLTYRKSNEDAATIQVLYHFALDLQHGPI